MCDPHELNELNTNKSLPINVVYEILIRILNTNGTLRFEIKISEG